MSPEGQTQQMVIAREQLTTLHRELKLSEAQLIELVGGEKRKAKRLIMSAILACADTPKLRQCTSKSVVRAVLQAAIVGLDLVNGEGWIVPYKDTATFMPGYRGYKRKAAEAGYLLYASVVRIGDQFSYQAVPLVLTHTPDIDANGAIRAAYATAGHSSHHPDQRLVGAQVISAAELEKAKKLSKGRDGSSPSPAWKEWPERMALKLVIRRLCQDLDLREGSMRDLIRVDEQADRGGVDVDLDDVEDITPTIEDPLTDGPHRFGFAPVAAVDSSELVRKDGQI